MRVTLLLSALASAAVATAQTTNGMNEITLQGAMQTLREGNQLELEMRGWDTVGTTRTAVHAILYWKLEYDARTRKQNKALVDLYVFTPTATGEQVTLRILGDGTTLRRYDLARREVSSTVYGAYGAAVPASYDTAFAPRLMAGLRAAAPGPAAYLARLASDLMPAGSEYSATYSGWMPGYRSWTLLEIPDEEHGGKRKINVPEIAEDDTVADPLTGQPYTQGYGWVTYGVNLPNPPRTLAFELDDPANGLGIRNVYVADHTAGRRRDLLIVPSKPASLPTYAFAPFSSAMEASFRPLAKP